MKNWKVVIDCDGKDLVITLQGKYYSDAYVNAGIQYPDCRIKSISELSSNDKKSK